MDDLLEQLKKEVEHDKKMNAQIAKNNDMIKAIIDQINDPNRDEATKKKQYEENIKIMEGISESYQNMRDEYTKMRQSDN